MLVRVSGSVRDVIPIQHSNAFGPMVVRFMGSVKEVIPMQRLNDPLPMTVRVLGSVREVILLQNVNALGPIVVTPEGTIIAWALLPFPGYTIPVTIVLLRFVFNVYSIEAPSLTVNLSIGCENPAATESA